MGSKQQIPPSILVQQQVRENASDVQNFLSDLSNWSMEMRANELAQSNAPIPSSPVSESVPLRNEPKLKKVKEQEHEQPVKISGNDYRAWEKFDAEKACEEVSKVEDVTTGRVGETEDDLIRRRAIELRLKKMANEKKDLGNQALKDKEYEKAVEYYTEGIRCDKKSAVLYANRAQANIFLKRYGKAVEDCNDSILIDPTYIKAHFRRAKGKFHLGKLLDAHSDLKHILNIEPGNVEAKHFLNEINRKTMQSLLSPSSKSAPPTPTADRIPTFPGVMTRLGGGSTARSGLPFRHSLGYDDDYEEEDLRGGGDADHEIYPKQILPVCKPPSRRSKRPLLPLHVKIVGRKEEDPETIKKMRFDLLDCNGNNNDEQVSISSTPSLSPSTSSTPSAATSPPSSATTSSTQLPSLFSQLQMTSVPPKPTTAAQFGLDWRKLKCNSDLAAQYLNQLLPSDYPTLFGESLEYRRLSEILELLLWEFLPRDWLVLPHLQGLASVRRFSTLALFMSEKDRANARKLISEVSQEEQGVLNEKYALV